MEVLSLKEPVATPTGTKNSRRFLYPEIGSNPQKVRLWRQLFPKLQYILKKMAARHSALSLNRV